MMAWFSGISQYAICFNTKIIENDLDDLGEFGGMAWDFTSLQSREDKPTWLWTQISDVHQQQSGYIIKYRGDVSWYSLGYNQIHVHIHGAICIGEYDVLNQAGVWGSLFSGLKRCQSWRAFEVPVHPKGSLPASQFGSSCCCFCGRPWLEPSNPKRSVAQQVN